MPFKYSCFISYRHGQKKLTERIISDLNDALGSELEAYLEEKIYLDRERLDGGQYFEEKLAAALCESVCLIVVFTPRYLNPEHPYCAREFMAMDFLERKRLQSATDKTSSLIIPLVFRGAEEMPEILKKRQYYDFQDFDPTKPEMIKEARYYEQIMKIARYIFERYKALKKLGADTCTDCGDFKIPSADSAEVRALLQNTTPPFPTREGGNV